MTTVRDLLRVAAGYHQAGALDDAERLYERILEVVPDQPQALRLAAVAAHQNGRAGRAAALASRLLGLIPRDAAAHGLAGASAQDLGRTSRAVAAYRRGLALAPSDAGLRINLGTGLRDLGEPGDAARCHRLAAWLEPVRAEAHNNLGNALREAGRPHRAASALRRALALAPADHRARGNLAAALMASGARAEASALLDDAIGAVPRDAGIRLVHATLLQDAGRLLDARAKALAALALEPGAARGWCHLGRLEQALGRPGAAAPTFGRAVALERGRAEAHRGQGAARLALGDRVAAGRSLRRALALAPDDPQAFGELAATLDEDRGSAALSHTYRLVIGADPRSAVAHCNLGVVHRYADRHDAARTSIRRALALAPGYAHAYGMLAVVLQETWWYAEAVAAHRRALWLAPQVATAHGNLALLLTETEAYAGALAATRRAQALSPGDHVIRFNATFIYWRLGRLADGHRCYEAGLSCGQRAVIRPIPLPRWRGEPIADKRLFVEGEQGVGDEIRFAGCYRDVIARAGQAVIAVEPRLVSLFQRSFPEAEIRSRFARPGTPPPRDADLWMPAGSLQGVLRPTLESFPDHRGYLVPEPERLAMWHARLEALGPGLRVGISWRSKRMKIQSFADLTTLPMWRPALEVPGTVFVNLQYDRVDHEIAEARERFGVTVHHWPEEDLMNDFETAAALSAAVDVAICVATSPNDLAGAVGTPVLLYWRGHAGPYGPCRQPWFPRHRLFPRSYDDPVSVSIEAVAAHLRMLVAGGA